MPSAITVHGSPHAEFKTLRANDNVYPTALQGYPFKITECSVCHTNGGSASGLNGPHTIHTVGQAWVDAHPDYVDSHGYKSCAYCHGKNFRRSFLSVTKVQRVFKTDHGGKKTFPPGHQFNCYDCHNGPNGGG